MVSRNCVIIAKSLSRGGKDIDIGLCEVGGLIHDIGRSVTFGMGHGMEGAKIMREYPRLARICLTHIGGGISKDEAGALGLPEEDYLPKTLEEKTVCLADKLTCGKKTVSFEEAVRRYAQMLGGEHPSIKRIRRLYEDIGRGSGL